MVELTVLLSLLLLRLLITRCCDILTLSVLALLIRYLLLARFYTRRARLPAR
jgi:hypothetical protein